MHLGILSDTHDEHERTRLAIAMLAARGAEALVHCGDVTGRRIVETCSLMPCYFTFGNNDADYVPELEKAIRQGGGVCVGWGGVIELAGKRIGVTHGHLRGNVQRVMDARPDYLLSGHWHVRVDYQDGRTRRINPGALSRADEFSVAVLDLATDKLEFVVVSP